MRGKSSYVNLGNDAQGKTSGDISAKSDEMRIKQVKSSRLLETHIALYIGE